MSAAARRHKQLRAQKLQQQEQQTRVLAVHEDTVPDADTESGAVPMEEGTA